MKNFFLKMPKFIKIGLSVVVLIIVTSCVIDCKGQMHIFKVNEFTFQDETRKSITITGIRAKIISNVECNLSDSTFFRAFYIDFETIAKFPYGELNTDTDKMSSELAANANIPLANAKAAIKDICRKLEYGTIAEKYQAAAQLASGYGYTLKPLNQQ